MRVFGISDLHLSLARPKPMEKFGPAWRDHPGPLARYWREQVSPSDLVLIPGDISWALKLEEAMPDLRFIADLPGEKVFVPGNHDFWWPSLSKLRMVAPEGLRFVRGDAIDFDGVAVGGTRLWLFSFVDWSALADGWNVEKGENAPKIRRRELLRMERSLEALDGQGAEIKIFMTHFPPVGPDGGSNEITERLAGHGVDLCVFGHLHNKPERPMDPFDRMVDGVRCVLVSCDVIGFHPLLLHTA